jgi:phage gp45-like
MASNHDLLAELDRLRRKSRAVVSIGRTTKAADDTGNVQLHQVRLDAFSVRDGTKSIGLFGFASHPPIGSDAVCLFLNGDRSGGVVIGTAHQASRLKNLAPGQSAIFDQSGSYVMLNNDGTITMSAPAGLTINANVKINGILLVSEGADGTYASQTGQAITVQGGITTNID